ncbi:hypothetical protein PQC16_gp067 [Rhizobium phage RHph_TM30]|uniref:Uncharacterized protein n=1 Tax=Rhizobium phage RHph_TM30 TaxID=2509764 RepID=A0A7S5RFM9_9CAUD|nr:hypothetical protein PQC16_gp067 [Rhizobium phage RHph_TM30]QIG71174.1 hypothetical protein EVB93_067 [Rhizobium phage RHph_TM30]
MKKSLQNRVMEGLNNLRRNIASYPFICYTKGLTYPPRSVEVDFSPCKRFELSNRVVWMFKTPDEMRQFKRTYVTIDNSMGNYSPESAYYPNEDRCS